MAIQYRAGPAEQIKTLHWVLDSGLVRDWRVAVDGGANVGDWSAVMADRFETVHAFEPGGMFRLQRDNVVLHEKALMDCPGRVEIVKKKSSNRGWYALQAPDGEIESTSIDLLRLDACGLIKLDIEGAEGLALLGAARTIRRFKPVLILEFGTSRRKKPGLPDDRTRGILADHGYRKVYESRPDEVWA